MSRSIRFISILLAAVMLFGKPHQLVNILAI